MNPIEMIPVESTSIAAWGYDAADEILVIRFVNGTRYRYASVPADVAEGFQTAESVGRYYASAIKSKFDGQKMEDS